MLNGNLIEYDSSTLAPLGLVVGADELVGKKIGVINSGLDADTCAIMMEEVEGMEGMDCAGMAGDLREQAVVLLDKESGQVTVVQPNEDVSVLFFSHCQFVPWSLSDLIFCILSHRVLTGVRLCVTRWSV